MCPQPDDAPFSNGGALTPRRELPLPEEKDAARSHSATEMARELQDHSEASKRKIREQLYDDSRRSWIKKVESRIRKKLQNFQICSADVEDLVAEVKLRVFTKEMGGSFVSESSFTAWALGFANYIVREWIKKARRDRRMKFTELIDGESYGYYLPIVDIHDKKSRMIDMSVQKFGDVTIRKYLCYTRGSLRLPNLRGQRAPHLGDDRLDGDERELYLKIERFYRKVFNALTA